MHCSNILPLLLVALSAVSNVVAHPVARPFLETPADQGSVSFVKRVIPLEEFGQLAEEGLEHRKQLDKVGQPGVSFAAKLANDAHVVADSRGGGIHGEDAAVEKADELGTRVTGGVPVGVDRKFPQADDHLAKLCKKCQKKHVDDSDHPFETLTEEQRAAENARLGKPNEFPESFDRKADSAPFHAKLPVGEGSSGADTVKSNVRGAAAAAKNKLKDFSSEEE